jgi:hypothetical protein
MIKNPFASRGEKPISETIAPINFEEMNPLKKV